MSVDAVLDRLLSQEEFRRGLTLDHTIPARSARYADLPRALDPRIGHALAARGISRLYTHQAEAAALALKGQDCVVVTPTASGKTLCYNLPVLHTVLTEPDARALYLFPDQGPGPGPAGRAARDGGRARRRHQDLHLRRRHARQRPAGDPPGGPRGGHQPGHAAHRHPAAPHEVGEALREPALRRDRRAAHLSRRLRQPPGQRAPPPLAGLRLLRQPSDLHLLLRHHRQPARAGATPDGPADDAGRRQRRPAGPSGCCSTTRRS